MWVWRCEVWQMRLKESLERLKFWEEERARIVDALAGLTEYLERAVKNEGGEGKDEGDERKGEHDGRGDTDRAGRGEEVGR